MKSFASTYFQTAYRPIKTFRELVDHGHPYKLSLLYISIPIAGYTLMYIFLTIAGGAPSTFTPWLNISRENYYAVNRFLLAPSMIICWFTTTSFIQVVSHLLGGTGKFEQTLVTISLSISIAMWGALLHDLPMSFLSATGVINAGEHEIAMNSPTIFRTLLWSFYTIYFVAFFVLFPLTVRVVHQLNWFKSMTIGWLAFVIFQLFFLVFNR